MRRGHLLSTILIATFGCAGSEPSTDQDFTMTGTWRHSGDLREVATGDSHIHEGRFTLREVSSHFSGTGRQWGSCQTSKGTSYEGPLADSLPYPVIEGVSNERTISFKTSICEYEGSFEPGNPNRITGSGRCNYQVNGQTYTFAGLWQADRLP